MHILSVNNRYILSYFPEFTLSLRITFERIFDLRFVKEMYKMTYLNRSRNEEQNRRFCKKTANNWRERRKGSGSDVEFAVIPQ